MGKTALILMIITLVSKVTGLVREQFFAYFLGISDKSDIYGTSSSIMTLLFGFMVGAIVSGYIPSFSKISNEKGEKKANEFTSNLVNVLFIVSSILVVVMYFLSPIFVKLFAPSYIGEKFDTTVHFTRVMSLSIYTIMPFVFIGYLQIKNKFIIAELSGILMNFFNVITLIISAHFNNFYILAIGYVISEYLKYSLFPKTLKEVGYRHKFIINFNDENLKHMLAKVLPIFISIAALDVSTIADQSMASLVYTNGGVSAMRNAALLLTLVSGVIVTSITTTIYPKLADYASKGQISKVKYTLVNGNIFSFILILPCMLGVIILSHPIIKILFERGQFSPESTKLISGILVFYMPSIIGQTVSQIFTRGFYTMQNTKTPIIVTLVQVSLNIAFNYIFSASWGLNLGLNGLALATTASSFISAILIIYLFRKKYGKINIKSFAVKFIKILFISLIMSIFTYIIYNSLINTNYILAMIISIICSILIYGILILLSKIPEVKKFINIMYRKLKK